MQTATLGIFIGAAGRSVSVTLRLLRTVSRGHDGTQHWHIVSGCRRLLAIARPPPDGRTALTRGLIDVLGASIDVVAAQSGADALERLSPPALWRSRASHAERGTPAPTAASVAVTRRVFAFLDEQ